MGNCCVQSRIDISTIPRMNFHLSVARTKQVERCGLPCSHSDLQDVRTALSATWCYIRVFCAVIVQHIARRDSQVQNPLILRFRNIVPFAYGSWTLMSRPFMITS